MSLRTGPLGLGEEIVPPDEDALIERLAALHRDAQESRDVKERPVPRGQHPKHHGGVWADFRVEPHPSAEYRHGLFAEAKTHRALIRFSNGLSRDDRSPDAHGMAIKLLDVHGERAAPGRVWDGSTHDFVMIDHPVFFCRNVADYIPLLEDLRAVAAPGLSIRKASAVAKLLLSSDYRYRGIRATQKRIDDPLRIRYWSTTAYRLGDSAMRFSARSLETGPPYAKTTHQDKLRDAMRAHLLGQPARFEFLVQRQTNAATMPIEDPTVDWSETESPWVKVATIEIPPQTFDSPEQQTACENLSFTPWHALASHRPLGGVNRGRLKVYEAISTRRRELNGAPLSEAETVEAFRQLPTAPPR